ncbi:hypothetical protein [Rhizobium leguminosarum]|uniref:Uncharacterized protein n=1 Tax=Rhizobium leguminosarum TaxID=384 RepID=A0A7M3DWA1_RHILE|nr:hypothetical protein [Rhizobium leguminosarum]TAY52969.1 hypothetical protein ELH90_15695 [Rhizobium leguminosarum]
MVGLERVSENGGGSPERGDKRPPPDHVRPILCVSQTGRFLVMERLSALDDSDKFDRGSFPSWLNDVKPAAFGRDTSFGKDAIGRIKVMDYAEINFFDILNPLNKTISL